MNERLREQARARYVPGVYGLDRVARDLGVSASTVRRALDPEYAERNRIQSRDAKRRRRGVCKGCGRETRYSGHPGAAISAFCLLCANKRKGVAARGTGKHTEAVLALLAVGPLRYKEIRNTLRITSNHTSVLLNRLVGYGLIVRAERGLYQLPEETPDARE